MNITLNIGYNHNNNSIFLGRHKYLLKENMDPVLKPLLEDSNTLHELVENSGYSYNAVKKWIKDTIGISAAKYFKPKQNDILKKELAELQKEGKSYSEIAGLKQKSTKWVFNKFVELGLLETKKNIQQSMNVLIPKLLQEGKTITAIKDELGVTYRMVSWWLKKNLPEGIVRFRHQNNIAINKTIHNKYDNYVDDIQRLIKEGKNVEEIAELTGQTKRTIYYLSEKFNFDLPQKLTRKRITTKIPQMIKEGKNLKNIACEHNIAEKTVKNWIEKCYNMSYKELKNTIKQGHQID